MKEKGKDNDVFSFCYVYSFISNANKLKYIVRAEFHDENIFAIKFYPQRLSKAENKYSRIINKGDVANILITCAKVLPDVLNNKGHLDSSFGLIGSRTLDQKTEKVEDYNCNQRFRIYSKLIPRLIGTSTFSHVELKDVSGYLLLNNQRNYQESLDKIIKMFSDNYSTTIHNIE